MNSEIKPVTALQFIERISTDRADSFAHRFVAKANFAELWDRCKGVWVNNHLCAAIVTTHSKSKPVTANLQLLHTFADCRKQGHARLLTELSVKEAYEAGCIYYRVSSEPDAQDFYRSVGFKFWGEQHSGTLLSMFRMGGRTTLDGVYDISDMTIRKAVIPTDANKTKRGLVVKMYPEPR